MTKATKPAASDARPTVGRIVHMYDHTLPPGGHGGVGPGPYAAIITKVRPETPLAKGDDGNGQPETVDLWAFPPAMAAHERGGVPFLAKPAPAGDAQPDPVRYWTWPPRA